MTNDVRTPSIAQLFNDASVLPPADNDILPVAFSDDDLALKFTLRHKHEMRYVAAWGKWLSWTGARWKVETTLRVFDMVRHICRIEGDAIADKNKKQASDIQSASTISAVERLAKTDRAHARTDDIWDRDPHILNSPGGVHCLRSDGIEPHHPDFHLTKITAVAPGGSCPRWLDFLKEIMDGDIEMVGYLQRVCGYMLTGSTQEHAFFFAHGTGGNGKGVFINTITGVMGDYAMTSPMDTFTVSATESHPTELAMLRGARLVAAQETEEGKRLNESRIKALTGGDAITARFMRQDFFTFTPQFKLFLAGNHKPVLRNVDQAMRRRIHMIPFTVSIPAERRDAELADRLKGEWPGILAWMLEGTRLWRELGLAAPQTVVDATAQFLEQQDAFSQWLQECCDISIDLVDTVATLYGSWTSWAQRNGEPSGSQKKFSQTLLDRGFRSGKDGYGRRVMHGLRMLPKANLDTHTDDTADTA